MNNMVCNKLLRIVNFTALNSHPSVRLWVSAYDHKARIFLEAEIEPYNPSESNFSYLWPELFNNRVLQSNWICVKLKGLQE